MRLKDRVAVVTGGGRGIGEAIALAYAREGASVVVSARTKSEIDDVASEVTEAGGKGVAITVDLSRREGILAFVEEVHSHFPKVDILVNNAGIGSSQNPKTIVSYDDDFWDFSLAVNLTAPYQLMKAFLPAMIKQRWGRIINIASVAGKIGFEFAAAYCSTKHGLIGLTKAGALELARLGVTANVICPGAVRTGMLMKRFKFMSEEKGIPVEEIEKGRNPMQRLIEPEEVAAMAMYLASNEAAAVTGQALNVCAGSVMQ